jgi:uncharacterized protein YukE
MPEPADHVRVTPDELRTVAHEILDVVDAAHHHARLLGGAQDGLNAAPPGLDSARAHAELESGWQQALHTLNTKIAVDADTLSLNAESYAANELRTARGMRAI